MVEGALEFSRQLWGRKEQFGPPADIFSVYQALRTGYPRTNGRIVLVDQGNPVVAEGSYLAVGGYNHHAEQPWPVFWSEHPEAHLVTESLALLLPGKKLCLESVYGYRRFRDDPAARFFRLPPPTRLAGNWTSIVSRWVPTRGAHAPPPNHSHWLLDALPRLALLPELPPDTGILVPACLAEYQRETLAMLGVLDRCRPTPERHLQIEHYYFSSPTSMLTCYNPYAIRFLRDSFLPRRDRSFSGPRKFFIQRRGLRVPQNILEVEQLFRDAGWAVLAVEELTFEQEVQLFAEAEAISGISGSGFTNTIFCRPGCKAFWFQPYTPGVTWMDSIEEWMSQVVGFEWGQTAVDCDYTLRWRLGLDLVRRAAAGRGLELSS